MKSIVLLLLVSVTAQAQMKNMGMNQPKTTLRQDVEQQQKQGQQQKQRQQQEQDQSTDVDVGVDVDTNLAATAEAEASNQGNTQVTEFEASAPSPVLVPNNNTESCLRVFGFAGSTRDGSALFGIPWRSKECDLEAAADDAFAQGRMELGWRLKCKQRNIRKTFGDRDWRRDGERMCLQTVLPDITQSQRIIELERRNRFLLNERAVDREECEERVGRAVDACRK